jgi:hypothetical protein
VIRLYDDAGKVIATHEHAASSKVDKLACACRRAELAVRLMNYRRLIVAVALIAVRLGVPFASAEPKAYDTIFYKGKAAGLKIVFEFGQSHVEVSMISQ